MLGRAIEAAGLGEMQGQCFGIGVTGGLERQRQTIVQQHRIGGGNPPPDDVPDAVVIQLDFLGTIRLARANQLGRTHRGQYAVFAGVDVRGKDGLASMICCGTNMIFRRDALEEVGGFPTDSVTEEWLPAALPGRSSQAH